MTTPIPTHLLPTVAIVGNTYPVRDELKALGCWWDRRTKLRYQKE